MATLPTDPAQLLARVRVLGPLWVEHAAELGLSPEMIEQLQSTLAECGGAAEEARRTRDAAQNATRTYYDAADRLYRASAAIVRTVRANALNSGDRGLYPAAGIEPPGPRRRSAPPPGQPYALRYHLDALGTLHLTWKSKNPRGVANVIYEVSRKVFHPDGTTDGPMRVIGLGAGTRTFTDTSVPAGAASVWYQVRPLRGRQKGEASPVLIVRFGAGQRQQTAMLAA